MCQFKEVNFASKSIKFNLFKSQTVSQTMSGVDTGSYVANLMLIYLSILSGHLKKLGMINDGTFSCVRFKSSQDL